MNVCNLMGRLTRDPELKTFGEGKMVVNFGLAINRSYKKNNETVKETVFVDCEAWDTGAQMINKYLKKGDLVLIEGSLKQDNWESNGEKRSKLKVRVDKFHFTGGGKKTTDETSEPSPDVSGESTDTDVPF